MMKIDDSGVCTARNAALPQRSNVCIQCSLLTSSSLTVLKRGELPAGKEGNQEATAPHNTISEQAAKPDKGVASSVAIMVSSDQGNNLGTAFCLAHTCYIGSYISKSC
jgi:hypothetical protein